MRGVQVWQHIIFNFNCHISSKPGNKFAYIRNSKTPSSLYLTMKLYLKIGGKSVISVLLYILYNCMILLSTDVFNSVTGCWKQMSKMVVPRFIKDMFTNTGGFVNFFYDNKPN